MVLFYVLFLLFHPDDPLLVLLLLPLFLLVLFPLQMINGIKPRRLDRRVRVDNLETDDGALAAVDAKLILGQPRVSPHNEPLLASAVRVVANEVPVNLSGPVEEDALRKVPILFVGHVQRDFGLLTVQLKGCLEELGPKGGSK